MGLLTIAVLGVGMLLILGALVGLSLGERLMDRQIREQAELRREVGDRWRAIQAERGRYGAGESPYPSDLLVGSGNGTSSNRLTR